MELDRKAFHFDLDNKSVERFYTGKKNPWSDIQDFLESHCFEKPQYSGYESAENIVMSYQRAYGTVGMVLHSCGVPVSVPLTWKQYSIYSQDILILFSFNFSPIPKDRNPRHLC